MNIRNLLPAICSVVILAACGGGGGGGSDAAPAARKTLTDQNASGVALDIVNVLLTPVVPITEGTIFQVPAVTEDATAIVPQSRELLDTLECSGGGSFTLGTAEDNPAQVIVSFSDCIEDTTTITGAVSFLVEEADKREVSDESSAVNYLYQFDQLRVVDTGETRGGAATDIELDGFDTGQLITEGDKSTVVGVSALDMTLTAAGASKSFQLELLEHSLSVEPVPTRGIKLTQIANGRIWVDGIAYTILTIEPLEAEDDLMGSMNYLGGFLQIRADETGESMFVDITGQETIEVLITYVDGDELELSIPLE